MKFAWTVALTAATALGATPPAKTGPIIPAYIEVNTNSLLNTGRYTLENGANVFDIAIIFASNIKMNNNSEAIIYNNPNVQALLNNATTQIRPLQDKGIKVVLSLLGGGEGVGIANFATQAAAQRFAGLIKKEITKYGLDGVDFDDEYAEYGTNGTAQPNKHSIGWLVDAVRNDLPDKLITFYNIGPAAQYLSEDPASVGSKFNYSWNPYYGSFEPPSIPGLNKSDLAPAAIDITSTSQSTAASLANQTIAGGYGAYLTYNLVAGNYSTYLSAITQQLYGQNVTYNPGPVTKRSL